MRIEHMREQIKSQGWDVKWPDDYEGGYIHNLVQRGELLETFEIGTGNGFASICMSTAGAEVFTFDICDRNKIYEHPKFGFPEIAARIHFRQIGSPDCFQYMKPSPQETLFYLDGEDGYGPIKRDFSRTMKIARAGDIIVVQGVISQKKIARFWKELGLGKTIQTKNGLGVYRV